MKIEDFVKEKLSTDKAWAIRALEIIYDYQTSDEKAVRRTKHANSVGFSAADAKILSGFHSFYKKNKFLTDKQTYRLHKLMPKYWRQIIEVSDANKLLKAYENFLLRKN